MLGIWEFFWDANAPVEGSEGTGPTGVPPHGHGHPDFDSYRAFDDSYWDNRAAILARAPAPKPFDPTPGAHLTPGTPLERREQLRTLLSTIGTERAQLEALKAEYQPALAALRTAQSVAEMKPHAEYVRLLKSEMIRLSSSHDANVRRADRLRTSLLNT